MKKGNIVVELLAGIISLGVLIQIIMAIAFEDYLYNAVGLWTGIGIACFVAIHLKRSIEDELDLGEEGAVKHARSAYATRTAITLAVIGIVIYFKVGNPFTVVLGIFPLKLSAYLQPLIHKIFLKINGTKES
jgi:hypothetical protein